MSYETVYICTCRTRPALISTLLIRTPTSKEGGPIQGNIVVCLATQQRLQVSLYIWNTFFFPFYFCLLNTGFGRRCNILHLFRFNGKIGRQIDPSNGLCIPSMYVLYTKWDKGGKFRRAAFFFSLPYSNLLIFWSCRPAGPSFPACSLVP